MTENNIDIRFTEHIVRGKDVENFCCDEMFDKNYWCKSIHNNRMRIPLKQEFTCANCPLYLFKLHIMGAPSE